MRITKKLFGLCLIILTLSKAHAESSFDKDLQRFASQDSVGYSVLISQKGQVIYAKAVGMANLELSVPLETKHIFEIGSLTKQFTAVAILKLTQEKKLTLDDSITKYISGISSTIGDVKIKHLLAHTSGLVDPINEPVFLATRIQESISLDALIEQFKNGHWMFKAGDQINYSNVGYSMLAHVIQNVSGMSYAEFLEKHLFEPLNMQSTSQASFAIVSSKTTGYTFNGSQPRQRDLLNLNWGYGAADLLSNTQDLSFFTHALMQGKILNEKHLGILLNPIKLNNGTVSQGSFTTTLATLGNTKAIRGSGSTLGYSSHSIYMPQKGVFIVVLSNSDGVNRGAWIPPATVAGKLAATFLDLSIPKYEPIKIDEAHVALYIGSYQVDEDTVRKVTHVDGRFYYQRNDERSYRVIPMQNNSFYFPDTLNYFQIENISNTNQSMDFYYFLHNESEAARRISYE